MTRNAVRLLAASLLSLSLVAGAQPAHAAAPGSLDGTNGFLCKILKISCP